ncbi:hypothetical protein ACIRVF_08010 [Kitasatospora sp. NPDC101157]|uniref:hypothetical protein n=1 Tax=Kitasatospora sp. NPDC101157 TaxID=3364098 RepID=UPI00380F3F6D
MDADPLADAINNGIEHALWQDLADALNRLEAFGICPLDGIADQLGVNAITILDPPTMCGSSARGTGHAVRWDPELTDWIVTDHTPPASQR